MLLLQESSGSSTLSKFSDKLPPSAAKLNEGHPTLNLINRLLFALLWNLSKTHRNRIAGLRFG